MRKSKKELVFCENPGIMSILEIGGMNRDVIEEPAIVFISTYFKRGL
jgi:hypothetical protein